MKIIGIDPGLNCTGVAVYLDGIWDVRSVRTKSRELRARIDEVRFAISRFYGHLLFDLAVIEKPQVYQGHLQKGDPNDLIDLAVLVGALMPLFNCAILTPKPATWKKQIPKKIHHARIRRAVPDLGRQSADALDAVGLALYGLESTDA